MKHTLVFSSIAVSVVAFTLSHVHSSVVLAAPPAQQAEIVPLKPPLPPGQKPGTELEPIKTGTLTGLPAAEWYIYGLQTALKDLQGQVKTLQDQSKTLQSQVTTLQGQVAADQSTIKALQSSLQSSQTQYASHTHTFPLEVVGHECGSGKTYWVGDGGTHQQVLVTLFAPGPCPGHPDWNGSIPTRWATVTTSTPGQGQSSSQQ